MKEIRFKDEHGNEHVGTLYGQSEDRKGIVTYHIIVEDTMYMVPEENIL